MDKNRRRILPTIPRPSTAETRPSDAGTSVAPAYPPMHSRDPEPPPVRRRGSECQHGAMGGTSGAGQTS